MQRRRLTNQEVYDYKSTQRDLIAAGKPGAVAATHEATYGTTAQGPLAEAKTCAVCLEKLADAVILPCGHTECCLECVGACIARGDRRCPTCRTWIENHLAQAPRHAGTPADVAP